jgi:fucose permease
MLMLSAILAILVYGMVSATWGTLNARLGFSDAQIGNIATAYALGLVVASISVGPLIDARGKKVSLVGGLALIAAALWALPSAGNDFTWVMIDLAVLGLGGGVVVTGANTLVSDVNESRRATLLNLLNLFFGLGGLLTPFLMANALGDSAVNLCYLTATLVTITMVVNAATPMPRPKREGGLQMSEFTAVLARPALYLLSLFLFLYVACEVGVWNWLAKYLIDVQALDRTSALNILSLGFGLGLLLGRLVAARILIKVSSLTVTLGAAVAMAIATFATLEIHSSSGAWVAVFCAGLAMAPVFPTTLAMVGDAFPRMTGTAMGIVITSGWLGLAVSSRIIGDVAGSSGLRTALLLIPAFSVAMIVVNLALRPTLKTGDNK